MRTISNTGGLLLTMLSGLPPVKRLVKWFEQWADQLPSKARDELHSIIKELEKNERI